ncbi:hypothetical protein GCM10009590_21310 [Brachybacterium alimentarium]
MLGAVVGRLVAGLRRGAVVRGPGIGQAAPEIDALLQHHGGGEAFAAAGIDAVRTKQLVMEAAKGADGPAGSTQRWG